MPKKETVTSLDKILLSSSALPSGKNVNKQYIEIIINEEIPVLCVNQETGKKRRMPFKALYDNNEYFWQKEGVWKYYILDEDLQTIKEKVVSKPGAWDMERVKQEQQPDKPSVIPAPKAAPVIMENNSKDDKAMDKSAEKMKPEIGYGNDYKFITAMNSEEKILYLDKQKQRLNELLSIKDKDEKIVTEALVDSAKDAAIINHFALEEAMILRDDEAKRFTQDFVDTTHNMVKSSAQLMVENVFSDEMMTALVKKSNGTIVQHMTRAYLNGVAFLAYYNNLVTTSSIIQKMRISFAGKYRDFYHGLLSHLAKDDVDLEHVFLGGMRAVPQDMLFKWAVGFLIHDIGKANAVEYHEGESEYDRIKVVEHVKAGYKSIMTKTNYPMETSLIIGYHHEYYGDPDGYGYFRAYLQQYKKQNPGAKQDFVITYDLEPMMDYQALAYFPAKVLEIVDVYDSVTDPHRVYRKAMSPEEALVMMRKEFIENSHKLDIILFDIFESFIKEKLAKKAA